MPSVLITGANRGLGLALARHYAAEGCRVWATCRDPDAAAELRALAGDVAVLALDVTRPDTIAAAARAVGGAPIDILLSNAGIYGARGGFGRMDYGAWQAVLDVNVIGALRVAEAFADNVLRSAGRRIVFVSSRMGSIGDAAGGNYAYRTSKAALNMLGHAMANDLAPRGAIVALVHPGWVQSAMGGPHATLPPDESARRLAGIVARLTPADSGGFFSYDGSVIPW